ncbi:hypothetical protein HYU72_01160 [Candidatus Berkelbacteria bacterium]|nr:hypothetical protein [Candidatus Berkelbacteria bacterium]
MKKKIDWAELEEVEEKLVKEKPKPKMKVGGRGVFDLVKLIQKKSTRALDSGKKE